MKLSTPQIDVLKAMADRKLVRLKGGYWTYEGCPINRRGAPEWMTVVQTVKSLEKHGLIERCNDFPESWRDSMRLTREGVEFLAEVQKGA